MFRFAVSLFRYFVSLFRGLVMYLDSEPTALKKQTDFVFTFKIMHC